MPDTTTVAPAAAPAAAAPSTPPPAAAPTTPATPAPTPDTSLGSTPEWETKLAADVQKVFSQPVEETTEPAAAEAAPAETAAPEAAPAEAAGEQPGEKPEVAAAESGADEEEFISRKIKNSNPVEPNIETVTDSCSVAWRVAGNDWRWNRFRATHELQLRADLLSHFGREECRVRRIKSLARRLTATGACVKCKL